MELAELRRLLEGARCFAVEPADDHNPGKSGWAWSVQLITHEPNSIAGMQAVLDRVLPAVLDVAEAARKCRYGNSVGAVALDTAFKRLEEC